MANIPALSEKLSSQLIFSHAPVFSKFGHLLSLLTSSHYPNHVSPPYDTSPLTRLAIEGCSLIWATRAVNSKFRGATIG